MTNKRRVVLITGCSSGFGLAAALRLARGGWQTFAGVRDLAGEKIGELQAFQVREALPLALLKLEVTDDKSVAGAVANVKEWAGRLDVLINNAGCGYRGPLEDFTVEEIKAQYETNVLGVVRMVKAVAPLMREQRKGLIINISSVAGLLTLPFSGPYSSSKYALESLSDAWRLELAPFGIKVVLVEPGAFRTAFAQKEKWATAFMQDASPYRFLRPRLTGGHDKRLTLHGWLGWARRFLSPILEPRPPEEVIEVLWRIANSKNPRARYLVGRDAHFFRWLKRLLPSFLWDALLRRFYGW